MYISNGYVLVKYSVREFEINYFFKKLGDFDVQNWMTFEPLVQIAYNVFDACLMWKMWVFRGSLGYSVWFNIMWVMYRHRVSNGVEEFNWNDCSSLNNGFILLDLYIIICIIHLSLLASFKYMLLKNLKLIYLTIKFLSKIMIIQLKIWVLKMLCMWRMRLMRMSILLDNVSTSGKDYIWDVPDQGPDTILGPFGVT